MRPTELRIPLAVMFVLALSAACGGGDDEDTSVPTESTSVPGPSVPEPPAQRRTAGEGELTITDATGAESSTPLLPTVVGSSVYAGRTSGFDVEMACGETVARIEVSLYFSRDGQILRVERRRDRWTVDGRPAEVLSSTPTTADAGDAGDAGSDGGAASDPELVNGVGLPGADGSRVVQVTLVADGVRYDIDAIIPWRASTAPATCAESKPSTTSRSNGGGGCGSGSSNRSRRSSGGDWD